MSDIYSPEAEFFGADVVLKPVSGTDGAQKRARWAVFERRSGTDFCAEPLGTVEAFRRNARDFPGHSCSISVELADFVPSENRPAFFAGILRIAERYFYSVFSAASLSVRQPDLPEFERVLFENGFVRAEKTSSEKSCWFVKCASDSCFTVFPMSEHILHISDGTGSFCTLVRGNERALLIDTSWGTANLPELVKKLVRTPFSVVNTHGHPDHCFGNCLFDEVLTPERDRDVYAEIFKYSAERDEYFSSEEARAYYTSLPFPPFKPLSAGTVFELGGVTVRTVPLYSHTHGSLGFLVEQDRILAAGDSLGSLVWLFMKESMPLEECIRTYESLAALEFDRIIGGHAKVMWKKSIVRTIIKNIRQTLLPGYEFGGDDVKEIMGYKTGASFFCDDENSSWILVSDRRFENDEIN